MSIPYVNVFPILATALRNFEATPEDWEEPTPYFFMGEMVDFICQRIASGSTEEADEFAVLIEKLASDGDNDVQDLIVDALEDVRNCGIGEFISTRLGPNSKRFWNELNALL